LEESAQIDAADGGSGGIEAVTHGDLLADLLDHGGRDVEDLRMAIDEHGDLILHVQVLAVGTPTVVPATTTLALDKRAREHVAEHPEAADEASTGLKGRVAGHVL
jgi:hypothetical protein